VFFAVRLLIKGTMKPQTENGHIQIATGSNDNDVFTALISANLTSTEYQVVLTVIRKTWGWKKKEDWISISQFIKLTGKSKQSIINATNLLVKKNVLVKQTVPGIKTTYSFNKVFSSWLVKQALPVKETVPVKESIPTGKAGFTTPVKETVHTKETLTKETIQKKYISIYELTDFHFQEIAEKYNTPVSFVLSKYEDMVDWHKSTGKTRKDWVATLRNFVKRDAIKIRKEQNDKSKIVYIS
jgi:phage replication O-like protein O